MRYWNFMATNSSDALRMFLARHVGAAALAMTLVSLVPFPVNASAVIFVAPMLTVTVLYAQTLRYSFHAASTGNFVTRIELPEYHLGDLDFASIDGNWTFSESLTPVLTGALLYGGVDPAGYVELSYHGNSGGLMAFYGDVLFDATVPTTTMTGAQFAFADVAGNMVTLDPPIPDTRFISSATGVPEPGSFGLLAFSMAALAGMTWVFRKVQPPDRPDPV